MVQEYPIQHGKQQAGKVRIEKQGLYYCLSCRCALQDGMYRLIAYTGEARQDLGILVPMGGGFGLDTRIPAKRLAAGDIRFELLPKHAEGKFVPIRPEEPFAYIEGLKKSFLEIRDGQRGILVKDR